MASRANTGNRPRFWQRLFGGGDQDASPLYTAVVAVARQPGWYRDGGVPDSIDGRFDMLALILSLVLLRLEDDKRDHDAVHLTERFIDDMDGQMRQSGFGDLVVGKQIGGIMAALGGRLGSYREGTTRDALVRNLWRGSPPDAAGIAWFEHELAAFRSRLDAAPLDTLLAGTLA